MQNPFFETWATPHSVPPFARVKAEHFRPAFDRAFADHASEIARIATNPAAATFANTIDDMERAGGLLRRVSAVFYHLSNAATSDEIQAAERELAPMLARHWNEIFQNEMLYARIARLWSEHKDLSLSGEQQRVLRRYHLDFVRAGAELTGAARKRMGEITERLATLATSFSQNVLADEEGFVLPLASDELEGLPDFARDSAAELARERQLKAGHGISLTRSSVEPFLQFGARRDLREKLFKAWIKRGDNNDAHDNKAIIGETLRLRVERAKLLGYPTFAHFKLADRMAKTPEAARGLLEEVWRAAVKRARQEAGDLQELIVKEGQNFKLAPWDWRYYAERLRKERYDLDESEIKPYLQIDRMIEASFHTATRLFGLQFTERKDVATYHPDVRVWEVKDAKGGHVGLFFGDYFARAGKRSGAWMDAWRDQERLDGNVTPLVVNVCNFSKGEPALLSFDDASTLFHEFGHALHGLLSNVTYRTLAGTNVATDFVELPSQIYEHWLSRPEILERFAVHYETGKAMPKALIDKILKARTFNQGFATVEFLSSALVDMDYHALTNADGLDVAAFEQKSLEKIGMPEEIAMRHRSPAFQHIFAGDGYSAGYYSYMWSAVLDNDGFKAFEEAGDAFDPATAKRLYDFVYSAGGTRDEAEAYRQFRGRDPKIDALIEKRGLGVAAA